MENLAVIILAAGKGTRMASATAKVLHCIREKAMITFVVDQAVTLAGDNVVVVVGTQADQVKKLVSGTNPRLRFAMQEHQLGTGHAVACAIPELPESIDHVLILCGDVPLIKSSTLFALVDSHLRSDNAITLIGATLDDPSGYGRLVINDQNQVLRIVEQSDASELEKCINIINTGIYCVKRPLLENMINQIAPDNIQNEMYLTDIIGIAADNDLKVGMIKCDDNNEIIGINTPQDLERAEAITSDEKP